MVKKNYFYSKKRSKKYVKKTRRKFGNSRIYLLIFFFFAIGAVIIGRLFSIQVLMKDHYAKLAENQHVEESILLPKRGEVLFSDETNFLAKNQGMEAVAVAPAEVDDLKKLSEILSLELKISKKDVFKKISKKNDPWIVIGTFPIEKTNNIKNIDGVHFESSFQRFFPQNEIASHIIGFYGYGSSGEKRIGQYGIEGFLNDELAGEEGYRKGIVDAKRREIFSTFNEIKDPIDGKDFILTLDFNIQFFIEGILKETVKKYGAKGGTVIVMNPKNGDIFGMASLPNFNPEEYTKEKDISVFNNPAISIPFEPGSIFKPIIMAAAIEEGVVTPETSYIDNGNVKIGSYTIRNSDLKSHGEKTMTEVLDLSLNTGMVFVEQKLGNKKFIEYLKKFDFGEKTNIKLANESSGNIENVLNPRSRDKMIEYANASFGQGINTTCAQIVKAFSAIANQGRMVNPKIIKGTINSEGKKEEIIEKAQTQVLSPETASRLSAMMVSVVNNGYGEKAGIDGYLIAGKTGTAQVPDLENGGYFSDRTIHSFVGFAPAFNPEFLILVKMDEPKGVRFSSDSLAPVFKDIAQYLFTYFGIASEK